MANSDNGGNDIAEALADVCTAQQLNLIVGSVTWRPDVQQSEIERKISSALAWHSPYAQVLKDAPRPSELERKLRSLDKKLQAAADAVRHCPYVVRDALESAGELLARSDKKLPDVAPERHELPPRPGQTEPEYVTLWDAPRQLEACLERLEWLIRCVGVASERTIREKAGHGSRAADDALHSTIRLLHKIYFDFAADPRKPGADIGDESEHSRAWRKSELLDFLEAALRPLGVKKSREAIYADWRRAIEEMPMTMRSIGKTRGQKRGVST